MLKIGITGGIGAGKTTITHVFLRLGIPVFYSDIEAAKILTYDEAILKRVKKIFGPIVFPNGILDRKKLAETAFYDNDMLLKLNAIIHPAVRKYFERWMKKNERAPYVLQEAAILIETGGYKLMDYTILVTAPENERIERVSGRKNMTKKNLALRIANQWKDEKKIKFADFIINNDGKTMVLQTILNLHKKFLTE